MHSTPVVVAPDSLQIWMQNLEDLKHDEIGGPFAALSWIHSQHTFNALYELFCSASFGPAMEKG